MLRTECQFHEKSFKISHWFQINLVYQSERKVGEILFRILLSSLSVLVFRLQISHLQWARDSSNKPVSQCVSEFAFMEFWASRPLLTNQIILRTGASEFWNVSVFFFFLKCVHITCQTLYNSSPSKLKELERCQIFMSPDSLAVMKCWCGKRVIFLY